MGILYKVIAKTMRQDQVPFGGGGAWWGGAVDSIIKTAGFTCVISLLWLLKDGLGSSVS